MPDPWVLAISASIGREGSNPLYFDAVVDIEWEAEVFDTCIAEVAAKRGWRPYLNDWPPMSNWPPMRIARAIAEGNPLPWLLHPLCDINPRGRGWLALGIGGFAWPRSYFDVSHPLFLRNVDAHVSLGTVERCDAVAMEALRDVLRRLVDTALEMDASAPTKRRAWASWEICGVVCGLSIEEYVMVRLLPGQTPHGFLRAVEFIQTRLREEGALRGLEFSPSHNIKNKF